MNVLAASGFVFYAGVSVAAAGPSPLSFERSDLAPVASVRLHDLAPPDVVALLTEDAAPRPEKVLRVGVPRKAGIDLASHGTADSAGDTGIWRARVRSAGALWLVAGFGTIRPEPGARVWVYTPDRTVVFGPFTEDDTRAHGQLWVPPLPGDSFVVEIDWPRAPRGCATERPPRRDPLRVQGIPGLRPRRRRWRAGRGRPHPERGRLQHRRQLPPGRQLAGREARRGEPPQSGGGFCSGSLITNTAADCKNYVLTAAHCLSSQSSATGTIFQFNFERPACGCRLPPLARRDGHG